MAVTHQRSRLLSELEVLVDQHRALWEQLRGARIFLTGGTGFFGSWLLETLTFAEERLSLNAKVVVLTRAPSEFVRKAPHLGSHSAVSLIQGDVRTLVAPPGEFAYVIHCATDADVTLNRQQPALMRETIVDGTQRVLEMLSRNRGARSLLASSGAVYGQQPPSVTHVSEDEDTIQRPLSAPSAYAEGKREAERLWTSAGAGSIARGFAFIGPYFPIDRPFAISNFVLDALNGRPIEIGGDGTARRSYLYGSDLAIWLWTMLCRGDAARPYNVGSEEDYSVLEVARLVAESRNPSLPVVVRQAPGDQPADRYVPSTARAREELGLMPSVDIRSAITRMLTWYADRR